MKLNELKPAYGSTSKKKRVGRYSGLSNRCKKAVVTLKAGQTIDLN